MESVLYSFMFTLIHSLWQSALLLLVYIAFQKIYIQSTPLFKRNVLFSLLGWQLLLSVATFILIQVKPNIDFLEGYRATLGSSYLQQWIPQNSGWLMIVYGMVVLFKMAKALTQRHQLYSFYSKDLQKASVALRLFTKEKAHHFGISQPVKIWLSNRVHTPLTFGFWKPIILLPVALLNQLSTDEAEALILHELTHIKAKDYLLNWLLLGVEAIYFFNPFIYIISQKIKLEREKNCDLQVLQFPYSPILYAESLLKTAQFKQAKLNLQLAAYQNKSQLLHRIQFFTRPQNMSIYDHKPGKVVPATIALALLGVMMLWVCTFNTVGHKQPASVGSMKLTPTPLVKEMAQTFATRAVDEGETPKNPLLSKVKKQPEATPLISEKNAAAAINNDIEESIPSIAELPNIDVIAVALNTSPPKERANQIIINEESNTGKKITTAYRVIEVNGQWYIVPLWMMKDEPSPIADSLHLNQKISKKDSLL